MLDNTPKQPTKFKTKTWLEINDDSRGTYNTNSQFKFKTLMLTSDLCDYSHAHKLVSKIITITGAGNANTAKRLEKMHQGIILKNV